VWFFGLFYPRAVSDSIGSKPEDRGFLAMAKPKLECIHNKQFEEKLMPGGHASHKGSSAKPNTNASGQIDDAADTSVNPEAELELSADALRVPEAPTNEAATQRPENKTEEE